MLLNMKNKSKQGIKISKTYKPTDELSKRFTSILLNDAIESQKRCPCDFHSVWLTLIQSMQENGI